MATPSITFNQVSGSTNGSPSYFDISVSASSYSGLTTGNLYDGWCLNPGLQLPFGINFTAYVYSSLEVGSWGSSVSTLSATAKSKLDEINWVLNYFDDKVDAAVTYGDVQAAMWTLAGYSWASETPYIGPYSQARVDSLVAAANTHDGYVPAAGDPLALVMDPHKADGTGGYQPIIVTVKAAALGDYVWEDSNANGVQDGTEKGISGATVSLVRDLNGDGTISSNEVLATTTTDANGHYQFNGLTPGFDYQVQFNTPTGYTNASPRQADGSSASGTNSDGALSDVVRLAPGEYNPTLDSGFYKLAALGDRVWNDTNGNGQQDTGETGRSGVKVELYTCAVNGQVEGLVATTTTDANGNYLFDGLKPGTYHVQFYAPTGTSFTTVDVGDDTLDSDANSSGITGCYTLNSGDKNLTADAGIVPLGSLGDRVWLDTNANGQQDAGEVGKSGVTVQLLNSAGTVIGIQATDANGNYLFTNLAAGSYSVQFGSVSGYKFTGADTGNDTTDSDANAITGKTGTYTLGIGETNLTVDAGIYQLASLGDRVWNDTNGNGKQDAGETGRSGVKVELFNCSTSALVATTTTDANGNYLFSELTPGTYHVKFYAPTGTSFSTVDVGDDTLDSDANSIGITGCYTLNSGDKNLTVDAGIVPLGSLGDRVWLDTNANGQQDAGEVGKSGVTVQLLNSAGTVIGTQTTDANGNYLFTNLAAGSYSVQFGSVTGYKFTGANTGADATDSDADATTGKTSTYTLGIGENNLTVDAGLLQLSALGDRVWFDSNRNGVQDAGEVGKAGVYVSLYNVGADGLAGTADDTWLKYTITDANGNYKFDNLTAGKYAIWVADGWGLNSAVEQVTGANKGGNDATDSDISKVLADGVSGYSDVVNLGWGETNLTVDVGIVDKLGALGDRVWYDANRNGIQDAGEKGLAGVYVNLFTLGADGKAGTSDDVWVNGRSEITDANGNYLFTNLTAGSYYARVYNGWGLDASKQQLTTLNTGGNEATDSDITKDADGVSGYSDVFTIGRGETNLNLDIGVVDKLAALGDRVWFDSNHNGIQDAGEKGVAGVYVNLFNVGADGKANTADDVYVAQQITDANGNYLFSNLTPGSYYARVYNGWGLDASKQQLTTINASGNEATDSDINKDADGISGYSDVFTIGAGETNLNLDIGIFSKTAPDAAKVCEDRSTTFNVLTNDAAGLKLVGVAHETAALDTLFQANAGAISFTADGQVTYKTMTNYYGYDKLVYTVEDAAGNRTTQTVDMTINGVSDAPTTNSGPGVKPSTPEYAQIYGEKGVYHWVYTVKLADLGTFSDKADELQQFGTYNANLTNDVDTIKSVVITGLNTNTASTADLLFNGKILDFSKGQTYTYSLADINAGKLQIDMHQVSTKYIIGFEYIDTGSITNAACYNGSILSNDANAAVSSPTPIAIDLDGDGKIGVTGATSSYQKDPDAALGRTVQFDIDGDGKPNTIEWFNGSGDGILIDNRDGHAATDMSGLRLFGDQGGAYGNGYYKLAGLDTNGDGKLSGDELKGVELWVDNGDAVVQSGEIRTLADFGITEISTKLVLSYDADNKLHIGSTATRADGSQILSEDVYFAAAPDAAPKLSDLVTDESGLAQMLGPVQSKDGAASAEQVSGIGSVPADSSGSHAELAAASEAAQVLRHLIEARHGVMEMHAA